MAFFRCNSGSGFTGTITIKGYIAHKANTGGSAVGTEITKTNTSQKNSKTLTITVENGVVTSFTSSIQKSTQKIYYSTTSNVTAQGGFWIDEVTIS